jgi:hypothetical protein
MKITVTALFRKVFSLVLLASLFSPVLFAEDAPLKSTHAAANIAPVPPVPVPVKTLVEYRGRFTPEAENVLSGALARKFPQLPKTDFKLISDKEGFNSKRLSKVPPPGTHPRVLMSPEDIRGIKDKIALGDKADMIFRKAVEEIKLQASGKSGMHDPIYTKGLLALITDDKTLGREAATLLVECAKYLEPIIDILNSHPDTKGFRENWWYYSRTNVKSVGGTPYKEAYDKGGEKLIKELAAKSVEFSTDNLDAGMLYVYDYTYPFMTDEEIITVRRVISKLTKNRYTTGMELPGHMLINNQMSMGQDFLLLALAIEGEEGYEPRILEQYTPRLYDNLSYNISPDGILYERLKGFIPHLAVLAAGRRDNNILRHNHLLAMLYACAYNARKLYYNSKNGKAVARSWHCGYGSGSLHDNILYSLWVMKPLYPGDPLLDFLYKTRLKDNGLLSGPEKVFRGIWTFNNRREMDLMLWAATDGLRDKDGKVIDYDKMDILPESIRSKFPLDFKDLQRGVTVSRSGWDQDAAIVHFESRSENFADGLETPECGDFQFFSHGVSWSPWLGPDKDCYFRNMVIIDGISGAYPPVQGRLMNVIDKPEAATFVSDATDQYNWGALGKNLYLWHGLLNGGGIHTRSDIWTKSPFSLGRNWELPFPKNAREHFEGFASLDWGAWHGETRGPYYFNRFNKIDHVYRTFHFARGEKPYVLVMDDLNKDGKPHQYDWLFNVGPDIVLHKIQNGQKDINTDSADLFGTDIILTVADLSYERYATGGAFRGEYGSTYSREPRKGAQMLLVRVLWRNTASPYPYPSFEETDMEGFTAKRIRVPARSADPEYRILIYPYLFGEDLPLTKWNDGRTKLNVSVKGKTDVYTFGKTDNGRTVMMMERDGKFITSTPAGPAAPILDTPVGWTPDLNKEAEPRKIIFDNETAVKFMQTPMGTAIHYTLDNSVPTINSTSYSSPFNVKQNCTLKARTFAYYWPYRKDNGSETIEVHFEKVNPAVAVKPASASIAPGLACDVFEIHQTIFEKETGFFTGKKNMMPDLNALKPLLHCKVDNFDIPLAEPKLPASEMAMGFYRFRGFFQAEKDGVFGFRVNSCGPAVLKVGGQVVLSVTGQYGLSEKNRYGQAVLKAGMQSVELVVCDPVFWKGKTEEPYKIEVSVMPPGTSKYSALRNSQIFTNELNLKPAEAPKFPMGKTVTAEGLIPGLRMTCFDRTAKPMDIPPEGLAPEKLTVSKDEKPYLTRPTLILEGNDSSGRLVVYEGFFRANRQGLYEFRLDRNGANQLFIDNVEIIRNHLKATSLPGQIVLGQGLHNFSLRMAQSLSTCEVKEPGRKEFEPVIPGVFGCPANTPNTDDGRLVAYLDCEKIDGEKLDVKGAAGVIAKARNSGSIVGKIGNGLKLRGGNSNITVSSLPMPENALTLCYWYRIDKLSDVTIIGGSTDSCPIAKMRRFNLFAEYLRNSPAANCDLGTMGIKPGEWFHVGIAYGGKVEIFVNGELRATVSKTDLRKHAQIGELFLFSGLDGAVDDVRIYNKVLDAETVKKLYETTMKQ